MNNLKAYYDRLKGSTIACIGFILSPLSWWNDPFINIPIAYSLAWIASFYNQRVFLPVFVGSYLATNVLGLMLLHIGIRKTLSKADAQNVKYGAKDFLKDLTVSIFYTLLIVALVKLKIIQPLQEYRRI
ncbi:MAG: hypothetical protein HZA11_14385 [Nitrospirae bacterium]|nr:hypothetical protein [Nitrospirota bacterium]